MISRFNRYELKYLVHTSQREALLRKLRENMVTDPEGGESGSYRVTSLYYDSPELHCYRAKVDGIKFRRKLRVRVYGEDPSPERPAMIEIKQKHRRTVTKRRICVPLHEAHAICARTGSPSVTAPKDLEVVREVAHLVDALNLAPRCVISYRRQALMGSRFEPGLRVTFDTDVAASRPTEDLNRGTRHLFVPRDYMIMEVKINDRVPMWMSGLLERHQCELRRVSKYCSGYERLLEVAGSEVPAA